MDAQGDSQDQPRTETQTITTDHVNVSSRVTKIRILDRWNHLVPILSPIMAVLSFMAGTYLHMADTNVTKEQAAVAQAQIASAQWQEALQQMSFDEAKLIPTAFLMESFEGKDDLDRRGHALRIERTILDRTNDPDTFDMVVSDMFEKMSPDETNDAVAIGRTLDAHLVSLWRQAPTKQLAAGEANTFEYFLMRPDRFYAGDEEKAQLEKVAAYMWELDSFSGYLAQTWGVGEGSQAVQATGLELSRLKLVNVTLPVNAAAMKGLKVYTTCHVHRDHAEGVYTCNEQVED